MNKTLFTLGAAGIALSVFLTGCRSGGEKNGKTMWSIPSVKLSRTGEKEVVRPTEKANPDATAKLANERLNGRNPSVAVRDSSDASLRPDPDEIAGLSRLEEGKIPDWANEKLASAPESTSGIPSARIAGEVNDEMLNSAKGSASNGASAMETPISTEMTSISGALPPKTLPGPSIQPAVAVAENAPPTVTTGVSGSAADIYNGELPASLDDLPTQLSPVGSLGAAHQAGATMLELPEVAASASPLAQNSGNAPVAAANTAENGKSGAENTRPAALFMPGNINPNYPNNLAR